MAENQSTPGEIFKLKIEEIKNVGYDNISSQVDVLIIGTRANKSGNEYNIKAYKKRLKVGKPIRDFMEKKIEIIGKIINEKSSNIVNYNEVDSGQSDTIQVIDISFLDDYRSLLGHMDTDEIVRIDEMKKQTHLAMAVKFSNGLIGLNRMKKTDLMQSKRQWLHISKDGEFENVTDEYLFEIKEVFDVIYYGDKMLVFNEKAFLAMFPMAKYLINELNKEKDSFDKVIDSPLEMIQWFEGKIQAERRLYKALRLAYLSNLDPSALRDYAKKYPSQTKDIHFDSQGKIIWNESDKDQVITLITENLDEGPLSKMKRKILNSRYV